MTVATYVPGSDVSIQGITATDEYLIVDQCKCVAFYVDDVEELQSRYDIVLNFSDEAAYRLRDTIDTAVFTEVANAASGLDDGEIKIAILKFGYMLGNLVRSLVGGLTPLKI